MCGLMLAWGAISKSLPSGSNAGLYVHNTESINWINWSFEMRQYLTKFVEHWEHYAAKQYHVCGDFLYVATQSSTKSLQHQAYHDRTHPKIFETGGKKANLLMPDFQLKLCMWCKKLSCTCRKKNRKSLVDVSFTLKFIHRVFSSCWPWYGWSWLQWLP